jgi:hypothetical protein
MKHKFISLLVLFYLKLGARLIVGSSFIIFYIITYVSIPFNEIYLLITSFNTLQLFHFDW